MKKVYQTIIDKGNGNCLQASVASLLDKELHEVPHFIELEKQPQNLVEGKTAWLLVMNYLAEHGYEITTWLQPVNVLNQENTAAISQLLRFAPSVNGCYLASVRSPKFFDEFGSTHSVLINADGETVHDPNPEYKDRPPYHPIIHVAIIEKL